MAINGWGIFFHLLRLSNIHYETISKELIVICVAVFARLALTGAITPDNVMVVVSMVIAFYFGTQSEKKNGLDKAEATEYYVNEGDGNDRAS